MSINILFSSSTMNSTVTVAIITALAALSGAIFSQLISSRAALNVKRLEILFSRKVDAYSSLLERAGEFGADPKDQNKYLLLQSAIHAALIVASKGVASVLDANPRISLHMNANRLRMAEDQQEIQKYQINEWRVAMESVKTAMQSDITSLTSTRQARFRNLFRRRSSR